MLFVVEDVLSVRWIYKKMCVVLILCFYFMYLLIINVDKVLLGWVYEILFVLFVENDE